jgi:Carboxypeptidase regulatory-like domain
MKKKRTTKTTRSNRRVGLYALLLALVLAPDRPACAKDKKPKQQPLQAYAIVGGTVFRESGLVLPGAEVMLTPDPGTSGAKLGKPQKQISDARGEFAFRVPSEPMRFRVTAAAKHFKMQEKTVEIQGYERADVTLTLPESSNK